MTSKGHVAGSQKAAIPFVYIDGHSYERWDNAEYICAVPRELGAVTGFKFREGRVTVKTESGYEMIVPNRSRKG